MSRDHKAFESFTGFGSGMGGREDGVRMGTTCTQLNKKRWATTGDLGST
jgi:hypothetical protein